LLPISSFFKILYILFSRNIKPSVFSNLNNEPTNKIKATISNQAVDTPELGGGKGLVEAGFNTSYKNIGIDLSAKYADGKAGNSMTGLLKFSFKI
jgi:hypothetical protein